MKHISPGISVPIITSPTTASINISSSVVMNGSLVTSGSIDISGSITIGDDIIFVKGANFTSSWANNAVSSSYALTSSFLPVGTYNITSSYALNSPGGGGGISETLAIAYAIALG